MTTTPSFCCFGEEIQLWSAIIYSNWQLLKQDPSHYLMGTYILQPSVPWLVDQAVYNS